MKDFNLQSITGLTEVEAARRLKADGYNELPPSRQRGIGTIVLEVAWEPMFLLLVTCGVLYLAVGELKEALMLLGFVFVIMGITIYQDRKTERALEALRDLTSPRALVIRDGEQKRIPGREVVREDILVLAQGDRVPADAAILWNENLLLDESLLTGESVPVRKVPWDGVSRIARAGGEDQPFAFSGTLTVQGNGIARVIATGAATEIGKVGKALQSVETEETLLQKETRRFVRAVALFGVSLCALVVVVYGINLGDWLHGFLAGITLAMAMLPEEFPVVLTIFLALGAWRISKSQVLTRRVPTVETLGSATVLCVDKTGTLTQNRMTVKKIFVQGEVFEVNPLSPKSLPESFHEVIEFSVLASERNPFDPMEKALRQLGEYTLNDTEHLHDDWTLIHEYPLSRGLLALSHVHRVPGSERYVIAAKGAPEAISDLCHLGPARAQELSQAVQAMAEEGLRVLGVAKAYFKRAPLPGEQHDFRFELLGLVGLEDPVRPTVAGALQDCYTAGIRMVMITGDYPGTAQNIARQIGLTPLDKVITGAELNQMSDGELQDRVRTVNIFARVMPEQKLRLVNALKANGEIVAMTGDGVNDAPALKSAHIGIAMGERGTDVAREAASLVLLDDDFSSIVRAVRLGRRIFDNLQKAMAYILAIHVPIAGMSLLPVLLKWPLVLFPVHIVFLELVIDPACSIAFEAEAEEKDIMHRPPRDPQKPLFNWSMVALSLLQGLSVLVILLAVFLFSLSRGQGVQEARALTFTTLVVANLSLILTNRSWSRTIWATLQTANVALGWVFGGALALLILVLYVPFLRELFHFTFLHPDDLLLCLVAGGFGILWFEGLKLFKKRPKSGLPVNPSMKAG
ncbi:MAG TPA: cation-translocating P-type ATPase [Thermodesulfobacteriota bacterium]|nr:cation-translocating P-type ATPase [Thermodesulfobacteriota bacterium]